MRRNPSLLRSTGRLRRMTHVLNLARVAAIAVAAFLATGVAGSATVRVPQSQIDAVNARWRSLGITLPQGGLILTKPFDPPYSNKSFVVPPSWFWDVAYDLRDHPDFKISATAMRADLPTLRLLLQKVYIGYKPAQAVGMDWDLLFGSWDKTLARESGSEISLHDALAPWGKVENIYPDGHTGPYVTAFHDFDAGSSATAELLSAPSGVCSTLHFTSGLGIVLSESETRSQPHAVRAWDGNRLVQAWYVNFAQRAGDASSIDCGGKRIALRMTAAASRGLERPEYRLVAKGIAYLRTPFLFDYSNDRAFHEILSSAKGLGKEQVLLFDLRGNGGGSAPVDILTHWFSQKELSEAAPGTGYVTTDSCFKNGLEFNMFQMLSFTLTPPLTPDLQALMQHGTKLVGATPPRGCDVKSVVVHGSPPQPQTPFTEHRSNPKRTRIIVLTDNGCGSDCERIAYVLSRLPDAVVAGTSTYSSSGSAGDRTAVPGLLVLPHTHIPFLIGTRMLDDPGEVVVDVLLPTASSQGLASIVALARALSVP